MHLRQRDVLSSYVSYQKQANQVRILLSTSCGYLETSAQRPGLTCAHETPNNH